MAVSIASAFGPAPFSCPGSEPCGNEGAPITLEGSLAATHADLVRITRAKKEEMPASKKLELAEWRTIGAARQSAGKAKWFTAYVLLLVVSVVAMFGAIWVIVVAVEDMTGNGARRFLREATAHLCFAAILTAVSGLIAFNITSNISTILHLNLPTLKEQVLKPYEQSLPDIGTKLEWAGLLVWIALLTLIMAAAATLLDHPGRKSAFDAGKIDLTDENAASELSPERTIYIQYLVRSFERVRVAVYLASILLGVATYHYKALLSWPTYLLSEQKKFVGGIGGVNPISAASSNVTEAMTGRIGELSLGYGVVFSMVLIVVLVPNVLILRKRAWKLVRTMYPDDSTSKQEEVLKENKLTISASAQFAQVTALLAPTAVPAFMSTIGSTLPF
ncbi:hypothetical protein [Nisaea sediminum]|uniref:hypothetical protein n=1 Tax=Nisaea sediminum TaxID=2775867 RepID=UPI0018672D20|nr:hypothetical protein [Nisaea sediminum]